MQEFNLISLLNSFSIEVVATAITAFLLSFLLKLAFKLDNKYCLFISFFSSLLICFFLELIFFGQDIASSIQKGLTAGAISILFTSFSKKLGLASRGDVKKGLEKLLSTIVLSEELDKVVDDIIEKIKADTELNEDSIKSVIKENLSGEVDEGNLELIAKFLLKALNIDDK